MATHSQPHLQRFTPDQVQNDKSTFRGYSQLPKELRQDIWYDVMQRPRIIHLCLKDPTFVAAPTPTTDAAEMSRLASNDEHFWVVADRYQTLSKLFRVNSDAREAALSFYRARFPCWLRTQSVLKPGILVFNPEHDFLRVTSKWSVKNALLDFLYLLKTTYDPHHIGIRNLAVSSNDLRAHDLELTELSDLDLDGGPKKLLQMSLRISIRSSSRQSRLAARPWAFTTEWQLLRLSITALSQSKPKYQLLIVYPTVRVIVVKT